MTDIGNIKPPGPVWPQPKIEKVNRNEGNSQQQHGPSSDKENDTNRDKDPDNDDGIDEYA